MPTIDPIVEIMKDPIDITPKASIVIATPSKSIGIDNTRSSVTPVPTLTSLFEPEINEMDVISSTSPEPQQSGVTVVHSTISNEVATKHLIALLKENEECNLPCWWGIMPGETDADSIGDNFIPKGFSWYREKNETDNGRAALESKSDKYRSDVVITEKEGIVQIIEVDGGTRELTAQKNEAWRWYSIPEILNRYGKPEKILVLHPFRFDSGVPASYNLYLFYESKGFAIRYHGSIEYLDEPGIVRACPDIIKTDVITLLLYQPDENFNALAHALPEDAVVFKTPGDNVYDAIAWETVTGLTLDDFYDLFTNDHGEFPACFDFQTYWTS